MNCTICDIIAGKAYTQKVYEDDTLLAILHPKPASHGHIVLMPKQHIPIMENMSDDLCGHLFATASKISSSIFDSQGIQGTNIFIQNGIPAGQTIPHVMIHIIPRKDDDGMDFMWSPKQLSEEEMSTVELKLKEAVQAPPKQPVAKDAVPAGEKVIQNPEQSEITETAEENYLLKQLRRIP